MAEHNLPKMKPIKIKGSMQTGDKYLEALRKKEREEYQADRDAELRAEIAEENLKGPNE